MDEECSANWLVGNDNVGSRAVVSNRREGSDFTRIFVLYMLPKFQDIWIVRFRDTENGLNFLI